MPNRALMRLINALLAVATVLGMAPAANACSRVTWLGPDGMAITGRSTDWPYSFHSHLYAVAGAADPKGPIDVCIRCIGGWSCPVPGGPAAGKRR